MDECLFALISMQLFTNWNSICVLCNLHNKLQLATGNCSWQLATCPINRPIRALVDFSCNYFLVLYVFCCCLCTIAEWWKPQRGFARFYWLCSVPQGSFVRHSGVWHSEEEQQQLEQGQVEWLAQQSVLVVWAMPTDILWTTSMHRSYRCVFYTLSKCLFPLSRLFHPFAVWQQMSHIFVTVFRARIFIGHFRFL